MNNLNLYQNGIESFSNVRISLENLIIVAQVAFGALVLSHIRFFEWPVLAFAYAGFVILMLGIVLRKHLCTSCYYYGKKCHCGWGKLSAALFKQNSGNYKLGGILANLTWLIIFLLPIISFGYVLIFNRPGLNNSNYLAIGGFIALAAINGVLHKKSCETCKMRFICPGSAAKKLKEITE